MRVSEELLSRRRGSLAAVLEDVARARGDAIALQGVSVSLSYSQLDERANRVANRLLALGLRRGEPVALLAERGPETVTAALGVLKAGGAYSPLDPDSPRLRLLDQLRQLRARFVLGGEHLALDLPGAGASLLLYDPDWAAFAADDPTPPPVEIGPGDLYAVIFTSGSSGRPKGVAVEHRSIVNLLRATASLAPRPGEGALQVCVPQFDGSAYEIWATLLAGGRLVCHPPGRPEPRAVCRTIVEHDVGWAEMATGIFHQLVEHGPAPLGGMRLLLVGGEQLLPRYVRRFLAECPRVRLVNTYGPTEATVFVSTHEVDAGDGRAPRVPIGRPVASAELHVRRTDGSAAAPGERGELYIGGPVLARGYLNEPEMTAERFIEDQAAGRLYRTGDIVQARPDGALEFVGRADDQVKVRGYRVEPGEVEAQLAAHPEVSQAAVVARSEIPGHVRLVAYVALDGGGAAAPARLRAHLRTRLPEHMIPSAFVVLERLPLTARSKVDRAALPPPPREPPAAPGAPATALALAIAATFAEVLELDAVDPGEDFFELGGNSLLAIAVLARLRAASGLELPVAAVFEARTARALAALAGTRAASDTDRFPDLSAVSRAHATAVPATVGQAKALLVSELAQESLPYQSQAVHRLLGRLDVGALERALTALVGRHEILRTTFERSGGRWMQRVHDPFQVRLPVRDLLKAEDPEAALAEHARRTFSVRLDPGRLPLARWSLARLSAEDHALLCLEHHVVHDGVSSARLLEELAAVYAAELERRPAQLPPLELQYRDFAAWQAGLADTPAGRRTLAYWRRRLAGAPAELALPLDHPRPPRETYRGAVLRVRLPGGLERALERRAHEWGATVFSVMLAAYCALLARYAGVEEVVVGSGLANRRTLASEQLLGMIVNTVALRVDVAAAATLRELVDGVTATVLEAQAHQELPFEQVVEHIGPPRSGNAAPIYQSLFSFHDAAVRTHQLPGAVLIPRDAIANGSAKADLNVVVIRRRPARPPAVDPARYERLAEDGLTIVWEYNRDLFERRSAERMLGQFRRALDELVSAEGSRVLASLELGDAREGRRQLPAGFGARTPYERDSTIHELFAARATERPAARALSYAGQSLTYRQLDRATNRLAHRLRGWGVTRGERVGVCLERSLELPVAMLAVLKAGAAYVPLDPRDPAGRLQALLGSLGVRLVLTHSRHREAFAPGGANASASVAAGPRVVCLDDNLDLEREPDGPPPAGTGAGDAAYVMFTSGSTGASKGVEVPHRAVLRLVRGADYVRLGPEQTLLALAPPAFDASTFELWGALLNGGRVAIAPPATISASELERLIAEEGVTSLWLTAGLFHRIVDDRPSALRPLRQLLAGGDVLSAEHVRRALGELAPDAVLINGYGPTEGTTFTCAHRLTPADRPDGPVPIGRPIANTRVYVLDGRRRPLPAGVPGELWIGGDGVALGYAGDARLTAERFRPDPFCRTPGARMYRSGDRVRWREDGTLEFLGRADRQLKVRGFRVEPREVEETLRRHRDVLDVHVAADRSGTGGTALAAYLVMRDGATAGDAELRAHAAAMLPAYAVPTTWTRLGRLPLTANGKLDTAALPPPSRARSSQPAAAGGADSFERRLIAIWEQALGADAIDPNDDFFELGGHSLLAIELFDRIERAFGRELPLAAIFDSPTVRQLARALREDGWQQARSPLLVLRATGTRPPLVLITAGDGNAVGFGALARRLGDDQPVYAFQQQGINGGRPLHRTVQAMARRYLRELRRVQSHGPYLLGGRCLGAYVAYEMARRLRSRGEQVALLAVLDSSAPLWRRRRLADGTELDPVITVALREDRAAAERVGDLSGAEGAVRLRRWLAEPVHRGEDGTLVNRYLRQAYRMRSDVRDAFPDLCGADAAGLVDWAWRHGRFDFGLQADLLPAPADPSLAARGFAGGAVRSGLAAVGARAAGTGAAARWRARELLDLVTLERRAGAAGRRRERLREASLAAAAAYRAGPYDGVVTLIRSAEYQVHTLLDYWYGLDTGGIVEAQVPGTHRSMLREPDVAGLAGCLRALADEACGR